MALFWQKASRKLEWIMNQHEFMLNTWILSASLVFWLYSKRHESIISIPPRQPVESDFHADPFVDSDHGDLRSAPSDMLKLNSCNCDLILDTVAWQHPVKRSLLVRTMAFCFWCVLTRCFFFLIFRCQRQFNFKESVENTQTYTRHISTCLKVPVLKP